MSRWIDRVTCNCGITDWIIKDGGWSCRDCGAPMSLSSIADMHYQEDVVKWLAAEAAFREDISKWLAAEAVFSLTLQKDTTYTWCCDEFGCLWQASSESREQAHDWATEHTDTARHAVSLYIENE